MTLGGVIAPGCARGTTIGGVSSMCLQFGDRERKAKKREEVRYYSNSPCQQGDNNNNNREGGRNDNSGE